jgi:hypothetical protein
MKIELWKYTKHKQKLQRSCQFAGKFLFFPPRRHYQNLIQNLIYFAAGDRTKTSQDAIKTKMLAFENYFLTSVQI